MAEDGFLVSQLAAAARIIFDEIDEKSKRFQSDTGLSCILGCGECCSSPHIEAFVLEMLPAAFYIVYQQKISDWQKILGDLEHQRCVFYTPDPQNSRRGRCSAYHVRPSICRLFGFAAFPSKIPGKFKISTCQNMKTMYPDLVEQAEGLIQKRMNAPIPRDYALKMEALAPDTALSKRLPINQALKVALEKVMLIAQYADLSSSSQTQQILNP